MTVHDYTEEVESISCILVVSYFYTVMKYYLNSWIHGTKIEKIMQYIV